MSREVLDHFDGIGRNGEESARGERPPDPSGAGGRPSSSAFAPDRRSQAQLRRGEGSAAAMQSSLSASAKSPSLPSIKSNKGPQFSSGSFESQLQDEAAKNTADAALRLVGSQPQAKMRLEALCK